MMPRISFICSFKICAEIDLFSHRSLPAIVHGERAMWKKTAGILVRTFLALFVAGTILYVLNSVFMPKYVSENQDGNVTAEFYEIETPIDAAYFGSSTVYNAIPADFLWDRYGLASYTRANASQTLWQSYYLIKDTIKVNRPQLITLDVSFMKYGEDFCEEGSNRKAIDGMRFSADKFRCAKASMSGEESIYSYIFPILRFHSRWNDLKREDIEYAFKRPQVTYDGFIMEFDGVEELEEFDMSEPDEASFPDKSTEYLLKIIKLCEGEDIDLLLMKTPTYINNWYSAYDRILSDIAGSHKKCRYVNFDAYEDELMLDRHYDYVDGHSHLNVKGAEKFAVFFGHYIKECYDLPDHREEEVYSRYWDKQYMRYEQAKEQ